MSIKEIPIDESFLRKLYGNDHWISERAIDEIEVYCDLIDSIDGQIVSLGSQQRAEKAALLNAQSVLSSYAMEVGMKSLWALEHSGQEVPQTHTLLCLYEGLKPKTKRALEKCGVTEEDLEACLRPFVANRYSMEVRKREGDDLLWIYPPKVLRRLAQLLRKNLQASRERALSP